VKIAYEQAKPLPIAVPCRSIISLNLFISNALGSVGIHREFITAAERWIMEAKL
jgi:hypothetical protein